MVCNVQFTLSGNIPAIYKPSCIQAPVQFTVKRSAGRWVFEGFSERKNYREAFSCSGFGCRQQQKSHAAAPPPTGTRRRMERNRQKLVGRDKGSLTEQQTEGTVTTTIQKRRKHDKTDRATEPLSRTAAAARSRAASEFPPRCPPPTGTPHDGTWYGIPGSVWPGGGWASPSSCAPSKRSPKVGMEAVVIL